jgi:hypothetical protein
MQEWSFFIAKTVQQYVLIKEKSPLCMLPSPLNLITTAATPLHYPLMRRQGISFAGLCADKLLVIPGQIQSYFFLLYLFFSGLPYLLTDLFNRKRHFNYLISIILTVTFPVWVIVPVVIKTLQLMMTNIVLHVQTDGI